MKWLGKLDKNKIHYKAAVLGSFIILSLSVTVMSAWVFKNTKLIQIFPWAAPMQFNTALCFALISIGLLLLLLVTRQSGWISKLILTTGLFVFILALLTLTQYLFNYNLHIDQLFMKFYIMTQTSHPGRMSPNTSICFILASGFIILTVLSMDFYKLYILKLLGLVTFILGLISLIGYILNFSSSYGWSNLTRMAIHTSAAFMLWGYCALLFIESKVTKENSMEKLSAHTLPLTIFFIVSILFIIIWQVVSYQEEKEIKRIIANSLASSEFYINKNIAKEKKKLSRIKMRWQETETPSQDLWNATTQAYIDDYPSIKTFILLNPNFQPKLINSVFSNKQALKDFNYMTETNNPEKVLKKLKKASINTQPMMTPSNRFGAWYIIRLNEKNPNSNYLAIFYQFDSLLKNSISDLSLELLNMQWFYGKHKVYEHIDSLSDIHEQKQLQTSLIININGYPFSVYLWPTKQLHNRFMPWLPSFIILVGFLIAAFISILIDVWQRLKNTESQHSLIMNSIDEGVYGLNVQGETIFANKACCEMLGYTMKEMLAHKHHTLAHHSYPDGSHYPMKDCPIYKTAHSGEPCHRDDEVFWRKDGTSLPIEYKSLPVIDKKNNIIGVAVHFSDITLKKVMAKQLDRRTQELEASNKELESFSYSVSHDLRAPLRHIIGFVELLNQDTSSQLGDEGKRYLGIINSAATKMSSLIDDLLQFSRVGRLKLNKKFYRLTDIAQSAIDDFSEQIKEHNIEIQLNELPSAYCDDSMLYAVFSNLLSNAIKFTGQTDNPKIVICYEDIGDFYKISVSDNGVGFEPEYTEKIFLVFQRLHKSSEFEGTGIGLANVAKIIHRHGGTVSAISQVGEGATISFTIPKGERNE